MAILKDLIVHGSSRFLNKIYASEIQTPLIEAEAGIIKKLKADDVTVVGLLDVQGQMHTNSWTNSNIATIDGSFYITPTLSSSSGTVSFSSAAAATFTGTYSAVSSLYIGNNTASTVQWTSGSKILITGEVQVNGEWIPLGTLLGTLNSTNPTTSMPVINITDNRNNTSNILTDIYSLKGNASLSYRNLKVSLYQRADSSKYYPLGIFMTALGQNGKTFLDIYGGVNVLTTSYGGYADPNVRIGNLSGLPAITTAAGNFTPVGWGIYTTNGYFSGTIVSNTGVIGGWKLGASSLFNGTTGLNNTTEGIYLGTDGIRNYKDTDTYVNITEGVIEAKGVNLTGTINATAGDIGGAKIEGGVLTVPAANISGELTAATINGSKITANSITAGQIAASAITTDELAANAVTSTKIKAGEVKADNIAANAVTAGKISVDNLSAITANLGTITAGVIKHDTVGGTNGIWFSADTDTSSNVTIGNSTARKDWRLLVNNKFGVTKEGDLYASNVNLTGTINATDGTIGGIDIIDGNLDVSSISIGMNQVTNLSTALEGKQAAGDYATNTALNSVSTVANTALSQSSWYATCPTPGGTTEKVATITPATTAFILTEGATVNVKFDAKNTGAVGSITLNVNETGAKNIKYINNNAISNIPGTDYIAAGRTYQFVYDGTYWVIQNLNYNTNTNTIGTLGATKLIAGTNASNASATTVYRYTLIMKKTIGDSPTWVSLVTSSSTATSKTRYTGGLYPDKIFYMSTNVSSSPYGYNTGASTGDSYAALGFDLRYSTNCGSTLVIGKPVYLVGEINSLDGLFYLDSTWWTQTEPTTENGKTYIYLGNAYSTTNVYLVEKNPLMRYYRGAFRTEEQIASMTATSYITYINANDGIKVHNESDTLNYLQLNSTAISMYRNNIETLKIEDSAIRIGKIGSGQKNVYIDNDSIDIRDNENVLASFTGEDIKFYDGQIGGLEVASFGGANGVRIGNEEETHFVINNSAVKALNNNGATIFSIETTDTLIGNTIKIASNGTVPNAGGSITLETSSLLSGDEFYIEQILLKLRITAPVFDENGIICQNFQVNQTNQEITLLNHTVDGRPGNFSTISNFVSYLFIDSNTFKYGTASSSVYNLSGTFSHYDGQTSYSGQITIVYDGNNTLTFNSLINSSSFGNSSFTLESDNSWYSYSDIMVRNKYSKAPALTFGTRLGDIGSLSTVIGEGLYAPGEKQMTIGKFNEGIDTQTSSYAFVVGNGQDDIDRSNAFTVDWNGNVGIQGKIHNIIISNGVETKLPLFHFEGKTWTISSISGNGGSWYGTNVDRTIDIAGYTPVAIAGYSVWGGNNAGYCVVPRVYIDRETDDGYGNQTPASLQMYIWNQGTQAATNIKFTVEILYIADNFID